MHISFTCLFLWNGDKQSLYLNLRKLPTTLPADIEPAGDQSINKPTNLPKRVILLTWMIHFEHQRDIGLLVTNQK